MAAFRRAIEAGADALELDVHLTRDDRVAVVHDRTLQRTTTGNGPVRSYAAAELSAFDAGSWFHPQFSEERVPLLEDVLTLASGRCWVNVELKTHIVDHGPREIFARRVIEVVRSCGMLDRTYFSSFDARLVRTLRSVESSATTGVLYNWHWDLWRRPSVIAARCGASAFICSRTELTDRRLHDAKAAGLSVSVYTVNDPAEAVRLADRGVDLLISDAPDVILAALGSR
jgi:glycerophosphoryl diester phosphodiesterase